MQADKISNPFSLARAHISFLQVLRLSGIFLIFELLPKVDF